MVGNRLLDVRVLCVGVMNRLKALGASTPAQPWLIPLPVTLGLS